MMDRYADVEDVSGLQTLELFSATESFNEWMFDSIKEYCHGNILEIGSGIGNISALLIKNKGSVTLSDQKNIYCDILSDKFRLNPVLKGVLKLDLSDKDLLAKNVELTGKFDTVVALNVVEHIENESVVLENVRQLLKEDGKMIMLVPAFNVLYNRLDEELGHYRRYNKKRLKVLFCTPQWKIDHLAYFNSPGIGGWFLYGTLLKKKLISQKSLIIYNKLVPLFRLIDKMGHRFFGLSLITVATVNKK